MWQAINEVNKRKKTPRDKLKTTNLAEWIQIWRLYFKNLLENPAKITNNPIMIIMNNELDITQELNVVHVKVRNKSCHSRRNIPRSTENKEIR